MAATTEQTTITLNNHYTLFRTKIDIQNRVAFVDILIF